MKMSRMFLQTEKEDPKDADVASNRLLIKSNMIKKLVSGVYSYLPLGLKVIRNIENIIRKEMNKSGAEEILCSALQPRELWDESRRWEKYGAELMRLKDRNEREFCLGPTHEEIFTDIVRKQAKSYKQLPINLYQIQTKYRDEKRPRFGLIRGREFLMKDAYSFDVDQEGLDKSYETMYETYKKIFDRCGIKYKAVLADTGAIGGDNSHQFMALSEIGESKIIYCPECDYAADQEKAEARLDIYNTEEVIRSMEEIETPNMKTIEEVSTYLGVSPKQTAKSMVYKVLDKFILVLVRGDRDVNMAKLCHAIGVSEEEVELATEEEIKNNLKSEKGFIGPIGAKCEIIVDREVKELKNFCVGANKKDTHLKNVNYGRDFNGIVIDTINIEAGDKCIKCGAELASERGIEVGQVFKLGTKYSEAMNCSFIDKDSVERPMQMGCYGIGVSRTMAAIVEQFYDENGIVWPLEVAPYKATVIPVNSKDEVQMQIAEKIYLDLLEKEIDTLLDDRDERAGVKFKDADLLGIPMRVVVGKKASEGIVEVKRRKDNAMREMTLDELASREEIFSDDSIEL